MPPHVRHRSTENACHDAHLQRTSSPDVALKFFMSAGFSIFNWGRTDKSTTCDAVQSVFGPRLWVRWEPRTLAPHATGGKKRQVVRRERLILEATEPDDGGAVTAANTPLGTDGGGLGLAAPDLVAYLCHTQERSGGSFRLLDSYLLIDRLATTPDGSAVTDALWSEPVLLRTHPQKPPERRPLARSGADGRLAVTYAPTSMLPSDNDAVPERTFARRWHELVEVADEHSVRVNLRPGEILLLDNYRIYHGRDSYVGDRVHYRTWFWTDKAFGYPIVTEGLDDGD